MVDVDRRRLGEHRPLDDRRSQPADRDEAVGELLVHALGDVLLLFGTVQVEGFHPVEDTVVGGRGRVGRRPVAAGAGLADVGAGHPAGVGLRPAVHRPVGQADEGVLGEGAVDQLPPAV